MIQKCIAVEGIFEQFLILWDYYLVLVPKLSTEESIATATMKRDSTYLILFQQDCISSQPQIDSIGCSTTQGTYNAALQDEIRWESSIILRKFEVNQGRHPIPCFKSHNKCRSTHIVRFVTYYLQQTINIHDYSVILGMANILSQLSRRLAPQETQECQEGQNE